MPDQTQPSKKQTRPTMGSDAALGVTFVACGIMLIVVVIVFAMYDVVDDEQDGQLAIILILAGGVSVLAIGLMIVTNVFANLLRENGYKQPSRTPTHDELNTPDGDAEARQGS